MSSVSADPATSSAIPSRYRFYLVGAVASIGLILLALVDFRRGFLFADNLGYIWKSPYGIYAPGQLWIFLSGIVGLFFFSRSLRSAEAELPTSVTNTCLGGFVFSIVALVLVDLFTYRGVAATRLAAAGKIGTGWLDAFGVEGGWLRPFALTGSYMLTVWHATMLGILLSGLATLVLPRFFRNFMCRPGFGGSLSGGLYALFQPFCSCCAAVIVPSLEKRGATSNFSLAFVVGAPMLNISTLILSSLLLPLPYAALRIVAGVFVTLLVTYGVASLAAKWDAAPEGAPRGGISGMAVRWANAYARFFGLEEALEARAHTAPGAFLAAWLNISGRIALVMLPTLMVCTVVASAIVQGLPKAYGNDLMSVVVSAVGGTLLMVSTWTEIPLALQMIEKGFTGPAAALLVVLPPVSLPVLLVLAGCAGRLKTAMVLGVTVMATGVLAGMLFL
ncbi:MAG: permease [Planctomycetota bacterium]